LRFKAFSGITGIVIICALSACDNVDFDGVSLDLVPPPEPETDTMSVPDSAVAAEAQPIVLPEGPILYLASRAGTRVTVRPVAEIGPGGLAPLDPERTPGFREAFVERDLVPGTPLTLFAEGVRVGTVRVDEVEVDAGEGFCRATPLASGLAEFIPGAGDATRFLAISGDAVDDVAYAPYRPQSHTYEQRVAGLDLASAALVRTGATWPPSVLETRADMQALPLDGDPSGAIAATFMYQDDLDIGEPGAPNAYSMMVLGTGGPEDYSLDYVWYRPVSDGGKAAARVYEQFDWDGDGQSEILLEVFGADSRWVAAIDRGENGWTTDFESDCS